MFSLEFENVNILKTLKVRYKKATTVNFKLVKSTKAWIWISYRSKNMKFEFAQAKQFSSLTSSTHPSLPPTTRLVPISPPSNHSLHPHHLPLPTPYLPTTPCPATTIGPPSLALGTGTVHCMKNKWKPTYIFKIWVPHCYQICEDEDRKMMKIG